jgi:predicted exporter
MPTKRPRITVTETPELAHRLNLVAARLPQRARSRADLLVALTELGEKALVEFEGDDPHEEREKAKRFILEYTTGLTPRASQAMLDAREVEWSHELY